ncbi:MAG: YedE family putative selenium transporter [Smithellaceae bacterium]|nr:YedE family putative selenium transporter [Smithellaceae bacterium]
MKAGDLWANGGIVATGLFIGVAAALLQWWGNPPNMGVCVACMERDIAGALGLHRVGSVQYLRPEIMGFVFGSLLAALLFREYRARTGSAPAIRFSLGVFAMIGALVFLGCPWRALLRLAGGDWNAIVGLLGLCAGIAGGVLFLKSGYNLGRTYKTKWFAGMILPLIMAALLLFLLVKPQFGRAKEIVDGVETIIKTGPIFFSTTGPGSMYAPAALSLLLAVCIGFLAQRTRFCTMGAVRDVILTRDFYLVSGVAALVIAAFATNLVLKQFNPGWVGQPIAHANHLWNFLGMTLSGLAFALAGGCPGRQLILAGEGDGDATVFVIGMLVGAGIAHNFNIASSPAGPGAYGPIATIAGLLFCVVVGFTMREKFD